MQSFHRDKGGGEKSFFTGKKRGRKTGVSDTKEVGTQIKMVQPMIIGNFRTVKKRKERKGDQRNAIRLELKKKDGRQKGV